jgi:Fe-S-cluster containining protein
LKCCTFFPFVPNFLLGAILKSNLPGRTRIENEIQKIVLGESIYSPLGLLPSITYQKRFHSKQPDGYGNDESLLCPHYVKSTGGCGIWSERPSPCRSFYCESSYGLAGSEFWAKFEKFVSLLELTLAQEALLQLGFDSDEIKLSTRFLPRYHSPDPHGYQGEKLKVEAQRAWLEFKDPAEIYKRSHEIVTSLNPTDAKQLLGAEGEKMENDLLSQYWPKLLAYAKT